MLPISLWNTVLFLFVVVLKDSSLRSVLAWEAQLGSRKQKQTKTKKRKGEEEAFLWRGWGEPIEMGKDSQGLMVPLGSRHSCPVKYLENLPFNISLNCCNPWFVLYVIGRTSRNYSRQWRKSLTRSCNSGKREKRQFMIFGRKGRKLSPTST